MRVSGVRQIQVEFILRIQGSLLWPSQIFPLVLQTSKTVCFSLSVSLTI